MSRRFQAAALAVLVVFICSGVAYPMTFMDNIRGFLGGAADKTKTVINNTATGIKTFVDDKRQLYRDLKTINEGMNESQKFQEKYKDELAEGQKIQQDMKNGGFFGKIGAGFRGLAFTGSKRGRAVIKDGVYLMDKYDPAVKRVLDRIGHENFDGSISDEQVRRASKLAAMAEMGKAFTKKPFQMIFHPSEFKKAYNEGYAETKKTLEAYRKYRKFVRSKKFVARYIRNIAKKELQKEYGKDYRFGGLENNETTSQRRHRLSGRGKKKRTYDKPDGKGNRGFIFYNPDIEEMKKRRSSKKTTEPAPPPDIKTETGDSIGIDASDDM